METRIASGTSAAKPTERNIFLKRLDVTAFIVLPYLL
jgi:hypothetical protein